MSARLRILQLEDSPTDAELIQRELRHDGLVFEVLRVPIVVMTGALTPENHASCAKLGVVEFLTKPFRTEALLRSLDRVLGPPYAAEEAM